MPDAPGASRPPEPVRIPDGPEVYRDLVRGQGNLFLACYAEAHRVMRDEIPSMLEQFGDGPEEPEAAAPSFEEPEEEGEQDDPVFGLAVELYHGSLAALRIEVGKLTAAKPAGK